MHRAHAHSNNNELSSPECLRTNVNKPHLTHLKLAPKAQDGGRGGVEGFEMVGRGLIQPAEVMGLSSSPS